ncbi:hypothetical protein MFIFM68171_04905 [Madurella fahalii]|uniref:Peptidase M14 domain-containing protein n=1 Tax=Madurella fahalii TaxID=1157608 RepID=A0ABQ0GAH1_9PEZI
MQLTAGLLLVPLALAAAVPKTDSKISYNGYKAYRIATGQDATSIKNKLAKSAFEALGLRTEVMSEDLGVDIAQEGAFAPYERVSAQAIPSLMWFNSSHTYEDHIAFFNDLQAAYPQNPEMFSIGNSVQNRSIFGIHLWGSGGKGSKPVVYFHSTVHAREWITSKVVEYITYQLLVSYNNDTAVKSFLDNMTSTFSHSLTQMALLEVPGGASTNPCSETYKGEEANDTPENQPLTRFTESLAEDKGIKLRGAVNHARQTSFASSLALAIPPALRNTVYIWPVLLHALRHHW